MNFELARQLLVDWEDQDATEAFRLASEGTFMESYGDQDDWVIDAAAKAIGIKNLFYKVDGKEAYICFGDRIARIPPEPEPGTHRVLMRTLNETLSPEFECRRIVDPFAGTSNWYMPLDGDSWAKLEEEFGSMNLHHTYERLDFDASVGSNRKPVKVRPVKHRLRKKHKPEINPDVKFAEKVKRFQKSAPSEGAHVALSLLAGVDSVAPTEDLQSRVFAVPILTSEGLKPVREVVAGDQVVALHVFKLTIGLRKVLRVGSQPTQKVWEMRMRMPDGKSENTIVHENLGVMIRDGWLPPITYSSTSPNFLDKGRLVVLHDGDFAVVESVEEKSETVDTHDIYLFEHDYWKPEEGWAYCYGPLGIWVYASV